MIVGHRAPASEGPSRGASARGRAVRLVLFVRNNEVLLGLLLVISSAAAIRFAYLTAEPLPAEAGGTLSKFDGSPTTIYDEEILVSNGLIHQEMVDVFRQ